MRPLKAALPCLALLAGAVPAGAAPSWSGQSQAAADWCRVQFTDEYQASQFGWCRASECAPDGGAKADGVALYHLVKKTSPDVLGLPFYETSELAYTASVAGGSAASSVYGVSVRRSGIAKAMTNVNRFCGAVKDTLGSDFVVRWTGGLEAAPDLTPIAEVSEGNYCFEIIGAKHSDDYALDDWTHSLHDWHKTRFLPLETELVDHVGLLKDGGASALLKCGDCGNPGDENTFRGGNFLPINDYSAALRAKVRDAAKAKRDEKIADSAYKTRLTAFEADLVWCLVDEADTDESSPASKNKFQTQIRDAFKAGAPKSGKEELVERWRTFARSELDLYRKESDSLRGEIPDYKTRWANLLKRTRGVLDAPEAAAAAAAAAAAKPPKPKVTGAQKQKIDDAASRAEELLR